MRCIECCDCWLWQGAKDSSGTPLIRLKSSRKLIPLRRHMAELAGKVTDGKLASNICGRKDCVAPEHIKLMTRAEMSKRSAKVTQYHKRPVRNKKIAEALQARSILTIEQIDDIRHGGMSSRKAAAKHKISQSSAADIMAGRTWKQYGNPFAGLMR